MFTSGGGEFVDAAAVAATECKGGCAEHAEAPAAGEALLIGSGLCGYRLLVLGEELFGVGEFLHLKICIKDVCFFGICFFAADIMEILPVGWTGLHR